MLQEMQGVAAERMGGRTRYAGGGVLQLPRVVAYTYTDVLHKFNIRRWGRDIDWKVL